MGNSQSQPPVAGAAKQPPQSGQVHYPTEDHAAAGMAVVRPNPSVSQVHPSAPPPAHPNADPLQENLLAYASLKPSDAIPPPATALHTLFAQKTDIIPTALVGKPVPEGGRVMFVAGAPETPEEVEQLKASERAQIACFNRMMFTWDGYRYTFWFTLMGLPWTVLCPRKWHRAVRWSSPVMLAFGGAWVDQQEGRRICAMRHPMPRWAIERAKPISQVIDEVEAARMQAKNSPHAVRDEDVAFIVQRKTKITPPGGAP